VLTLAEFTIYVLACFAGLYILVAILIFFIQRRLMYFPNSIRARPNSYGLDSMEEIHLITDDGLTLTAWYQPPKEGDICTIVYFHGNAGDIGMRAKKIMPYINSGAGVLLTTWRGFSKNPGRPSEIGLYSDGLAAINFLLTQGLSENKIVLYGESLGTGVAVELASNNNFSPAAVILEAPFSSAADIAAWRFPILPVRKLIFDSFNSNKKISDINSPLLFLHGYKDQTIPIIFGYKLFMSAKKPKKSVFIENAGHNDLYEYGADIEVISFLQKLGLIKGKETPN
jgi:fermentation-respiration switch protein FrsA (DUF1100 family)